MNDSSTRAGSQPNASKCARIYSGGNALMIWPQSVLKTVRVPLIPHEEKAGRLVVIFRREGGGKRAQVEIVAHKKGVDSHEITTYELIPQFASHFFQRFQAGAHVICPIPGFLRVIIDLPIARR